jgi:phosphatidate cytidylyltransferase
MAMVPVIVAPVLLGAAPTILAVALLALLCYREFARATGLFREKVMSATVVVGILAVTCAVADHWYGLFVALTPITLAVLAAVATSLDRPSGYIQRVALANFGFLLFGSCLGHLAYMANDTRFRSLILLLLFSVQLNDVFAYIVGKSLGGPKLAPRTSPNKTISGSLGAAVLTTLLVFGLTGLMFSHGPMSGVVQRLALGLLISIAGQFGDLSVSAIKRDVGVKDTGALIPGHGGVLDRANSLLLSAPTVFHYINYLEGIGVDQASRALTGGG